MSDQNTIRKFLAGSTLFAGVAEGALDEIAGIVKEVPLPAGATVFRQGQPGDCCYIVVSGTVTGFRTNHGGNEYEFMRLGPGESFGELALLTDEPRPISARTTDVTRLLVVPKGPCGPIMSKHTDVTAAVGRRVSHWLQMASAAIESEADRQHAAPRLSWLDFILIFGLSVVCALIFNGSNPKGISLFPKATLDEAVSFIGASKMFQRIREEPVMIIDAMPSVFFEEQHIPGAVSLPLAIFDFMYDMSLNHAEKSKEIIVYGRTISKHYDEEVANKLVIRGHKSVKILQGGLEAWKKRGYPVES